MFQTAFLHSTPATANHAAPATKDSLSAQASTISNLMPCLASGNELKADELKEFLRSLGYDFARPRTPRNLELEQATYRVFEAEVASGKITAEELTQFVDVINSCCDMAEVCIMNHPLELKVLTAAYITLLILIDDLCEKNPEKMVTEFQRLFGPWTEHGSRAHHPHLDHFRRLVSTEVPKYCGPISTASIAQSSVNYLLGNMVESNFPNGVSCPPTSSRFPRYLRSKNGCSEAFAYFIFSKFPEKEFVATYIPTLPDINDFIDVVNDILSFYKECVVGTDQNTYVMSISKLKGCSPLEFLREECPRVTRVNKKILATLSRSEGLQKAWEGFVDGYINWHLNQNRYRLSELGL